MSDTCCICMETMTGTDVYYFPCGNACPPVHAQCVSDYAASIDAVPPCTYCRSALTSQGTRAFQLMTMATPPTHGLPRSSSTYLSTHTIPACPKFVAPLCCRHLVMTSNGQFTEMSTRSMTWFPYIRPGQHRWESVGNVCDALTSVLYPMHANPIARKRSGCVHQGAQNTEEWPWQSTSKLASVPGFATMIPGTAIRSRSSNAPALESLD